MRHFGILSWIAWILVIIGGLNWGLYGLFKLDLVNVLLDDSLLARVVYIIIGISAAYLLYLKFKKVE